MLAVSSPVNLSARGLPTRKARTAAGLPRGGRGAARDVTTCVATPAPKRSGKSDTQRERRVATRASADLVGPTEEPTVGLCAWRGDLPTQSSLPLLPNGKPDYSKIDASPISKVLNATIRKLLVEEVGKDTDPRPWTSFDGMLTSVREVNDAPGTAADVQDRAERVFSKILPALGIGILTPMWKKGIQPVFPTWASNFAFVLVFKTLFPWLMGPMKGVDPVDVKVSPTLRKIFKKLPETIAVPQAVKAERCRFVESTSCASVCVNTCKVPSQRWLFKDFGMKVHIQPNYDDFSCQWKFNREPPPLEEDEAVMVPCFANCDSEYKGEKDAFRQVQRAIKGVGIEDGVDKYTGETLAQIVARASDEAKADAARGVTVGGSALALATLEQRAEKVSGGGKCWSVDEERETTLKKLQQKLEES